MSEEINNRKYRQEVIKDVISQLHAGKSVDEVKGKFDEAFGNVSVNEITQAEQALIAEGLPVEEIQRLCDVHAAVFKGSIEEIHQPTDPSEIPGHPVNILKAENRAIQRLIENIGAQLSAAKETGISDELAANLEKLGELDRHYLKKENLLFPFMEKYGITAPPKVMWGVDDQIRGKLKEVRDLLKGNAGFEFFKEKADDLLTSIGEMIFKEENIMLPMLLETLTQDEWRVVADGSGEFGYTLLPRVPVWKTHGHSAESSKPQSSAKSGATVEAKGENKGDAETGDMSGVIKFPTGELRIEELVRMLDTLPIDITFVDRDDSVKYFSQNAERIFPRVKAIIGRKVTACHPPASVHIVEGIVNDFKSGKKDHEDFWIKMGGKYVYIRYFAVRSESGEYLGTLEVTQDIKPIQDITGEKRLVTGQQ